MDGDGHLEGIDRWLADARAREAADARSRERWLRRQSEEEAGLAGLLLDLAEREDQIVAVCASGRSHAGRITAVGADFVGVRAPGGRTTLVVLHSLATVRRAARGGDDGRRGRATAPSAPSSRRAGDRVDRRLAVTLLDVLGHAVGDRPRVRLRALDATVVGELRAVGADVITIHADGEVTGMVYARLASVSEVSLLDSG